MDKISVSRREFLFGRSAGQNQRDVSEIVDDSAGATAVEYGLIVGLLALALTGALTKVGKRQRQNYRCIKRAMKGRNQTKFCKKKGA